MRGIWDSEFEWVQILCSHARFGFRTQTGLARFCTEIERFK